MWSWEAASLSISKQIIEMCSVWCAIYQTLHIKVNTHAQLAVYLLECNGRQYMVIAHIKAILYSLRQVGRLPDQYPFVWHVLELFPDKMYPVWQV